MTQKHLKTIFQNIKYDKLKENDQGYGLKANKIYGLIEKENWQNIFNILHMIPVEKKKQKNFSIK